MLLIIIIIIPTKTQKKKKMNEKTNKQTNTAPWKLTVRDWKKSAAIRERETQD